MRLAGFDAVYLTGGGYSRANGYPDVGLLTMTEVAADARRDADMIIIARSDATLGNLRDADPQTHRAAIAAAKKVLGVLRGDGDTAAVEGELATFRDREDAVNARHWRELEAKYLEDA